MNPYAVGLVSVAVISVAVGIAFMAGIGQAFERAYDVEAVFSDASGLRVGDDVRVAGIKAGRVSGISADRRRGTVVVAMKVDNGVRLGSRAEAEIALQTLLGRKFVRLGGPVRAPYLHDLPERRRVIPVARTKTPFDVFELTRVGTRAVQQTNTERLNAVITSLADVTADKREQLTQLLDGITRLSTALNERDVQLRDLLERADRISATLADKDQTLVTLIDESRAILDLVVRRRADIARGLGQGAAVTDQLSGIVNAGFGDLDLILDTLHPAAAVIDRRQANIDRTLARIGFGAIGLSRATAHGPWADIYVREVGEPLICDIAAARGTPVTGC